MNQQRSSGWHKMINTKPSEQNLRKSQIHNQPLRVQKYTPTKYQGKSHKIFANLNRSPSNSFRQSQSIQFGNTSIMMQNDDYQIKSNHKIPSNQMINYDYLSQSKMNKIKNEALFNIPYLQEIKKRQADFKFQRDLFQDIKPIQEKSINYDILKNLQHQFQQFKKWIYQQLKKQQQMVFELANQIAKALQDQPGKIKKVALKRYNNTFKSMFIDGQIKLQQQVSRVNNILSEGILSNEYQLYDKDNMITSHIKNISPKRTQNQLFQSQINNRKSNFRPKSISHFNYNYERGSRGIQPSPRSSVQFNKFFDTMNKIKNQMNQLNSITEKHQQSMTQESRHVEKNTKY